MLATTFITMNSGVVRAACIAVTVIDIKTYRCEQTHIVHFGIFKQ